MTRGILSWTNSEVKPRKWKFYVNFLVSFERIKSSLFKNSEIINSMMKQRIKTLVNLEKNYLKFPMIKNFFLFSRNLLLWFLLIIVSVQCQYDGNVDVKIFDAIKDLLVVEHLEEADCMTENLRTHKIVERFYRKELLTNLTALYEEIKPYENDALYECSHEKEESISIWIWIIIFIAFALLLLAVAYGISRKLKHSNRKWSYETLCCQS